ncbi:MAG: rhodanese-like domain-containing protein [Bacilli bacterium]
MSRDLILLTAWMIVVSIFFSRYAKNRKMKKDHVTYVNADDFSKLKNKNQLIDVRSQEEYKKEHITGARNIPIAQLKNGAERKLFKNKPVYLYCSSGKIANNAARVLVKQEYSDIIVMKDKMENYPGKKQSS